MADIRLTSANKMEMAANEMVINELQDQIKYQEEIISLQQKTISDSCQMKRRRR